MFEMLHDFIQIMKHVELNTEDAVFCSLLQRTLIEQRNDLHLWMSLLMQIECVLHALTCDQCGATCTAPLPPGVKQHD